MIIFRVNAEKYRKMLRIFAGGRLPPLREYGKIGAKSIYFCVKNTKKRKHRKQHITIKIFTQQNPVFGKNPFTGFF